MKQLAGANKTYYTFVIFLIVIALHSPIYHKHIDENHHHEPIKQTDNIAHHHPNDYSVDSHGTEFSQEVLPAESHHTHYHSHFEKDLLQVTRINTIYSETIAGYTYIAFNNPSTHSLTKRRHSYKQYKSKYYTNTSAKTASGLSPPIIST